jgi:hypothetical protein
MTMTICKECRKEISSEAITCPHCGKPLKGSSQRTKIYVILGSLIVLFLIGFLYAVIWLMAR